MTVVRVATFNVENLFARWRFERDVDVDAVVRDGWRMDPGLLVELGVVERRLAAEAIRLARADVIALQEVESLDTLKRFRDLLLGPEAYPYAISVDGNDPRLIDVAVLSRHPIVHVRSYQHLRDPRSPAAPLFSRDCLEVDLDVDGRPLTLFVNHFKSMDGGRSVTRDKRERQAAMVRELVAHRFGPAPGAHPFVVLGDLNDYRGGDSGIAPLLEWDQVVDAVGRRVPDDRWTHYWREGEEYQQLDYLLLSASLAAAGGGVPEIVRHGLPRRARRYTGPRLEGVGDDAPAASDHCPVVVEVRL